MAEAQLEQLNGLKRKLKQGDDVQGVVVSPEITDSNLYRSLQEAGFDYVFLDLEHTSFSVKDVAGAIAACRKGGIAPWVRIPSPERSFVSRVLDAGATGLILPRIETREDVEDVLDPAFFPPIGDRGFGGGQFRSFLPKGTIEDHIEWSNSLLVIVVQFERRKAVENARSILDLKEVTAGVIGPCDLSISYGKPGEFEAPEVEEAIAGVLKEGRSCAKPVGIIASTELSRKWRKKGMSLFCTAFMENVLLEGGKSLLADF